MGNKSNKTNLKKADVEENVKKLNDITRKYIVMEFIGLHLTFFVDDDSLCSKKIIKVEIKKYNPITGKTEDETKTVHLNIEQFYNYYNAVMNSISIFYEEKLEERLTRLSSKTSKSYGEDESSFCPICEENKVNLCLPCSHFFCEECIKDWVKKSETCPLCRIKLNKKTSVSLETPEIVGSERWSVLSNDEKLIQEAKKDTIDILLNLTKELFNKK